MERSRSVSPVAKMLKASVAQNFQRLKSCTRKLPPAMLRKATVAHVTTAVIGAIPADHPSLSRSCWGTCWRHEDRDLLLPSPYTGRRLTVVSILRATDGSARSPQAAGLLLRNPKPRRRRLARAPYLGAVLAGGQRVVAVQAGDVISVATETTPKSSAIAAVRL
jgi:hypothetical protein